MGFVSMDEILRKARDGGYAVPSFCVWNAESIVAVRRTANRLKAPVIIMSGPFELRFFSPAEMAKMAKAETFDYPVALHLDHGDSPELARECIEAGFTSVMLDYSLKPYKENLKALREIVKVAHPSNVTVEGELGHVGKASAASTEGGAVSTLTEPDEAVRYCKESGIDALAVSIGNAHGQYTKLPQFDFERLEEISKALENFPLVLHGGSGTPEADLKRAISLGIAKVNVATELVQAFRKSLSTQWAADANLWIPLTFAKAGEILIPVIEKWFKLTGAAGKKNG